uniref:(northern house mosquito) hypothetical protein n=1 Tax=Culex pipiens TaxID=7175 RepID=A0A8D8CFM8_CULPI
MVHSAQHTPVSLAKAYGLERHSSSVGEGAVVVVVFILLLASPVCRVCPFGHDDTKPLKENCGVFEQSINYVLYQLMACATGVSSAARTLMNKPLFTWSVEC